MDLNYLLNICGTQFLMQSGTLMYSLFPKFNTLSTYKEGTVGMCVLECLNGCLQDVHLFTPPNV